MPSKGTGMEMSQRLPDLLNEAIMRIFPRVQVREF